MLRYALAAAAALLVACTQPATAPQPKVVRATFDQRLLPDEPGDRRTFKQRYIVDSSAARGADAPVVYFLGNEANLDLLIGTAGYVRVLTRELGAHFVALEHRYYGESIPVQTLTADTMRPLTIANALSDFARFEEHARSQLGLRGPWIAIGRSYGASLAAYYRAQHPELVVGAISAAPALFWQKTLNEFDYRLARQAGPACLQAYHDTVLRPIEEEFARHASLDRFKKMYRAEDVADDADFLNGLGQMFSFMLQMKGPRALCPLLSRPSATSDVVGALDAFMREENLSGVIDFTDQGVMSVDSTRYVKGLGTRQWTYQICSELGIFAPPPSDPKTTFQSTLLAGTFTDDSECQKILGIRARRAAEIERVNETYYRPLLGPDSKVSHLLVLNDADDPTSVLSISEENRNHTNPKITVHTVLGSAHHEELNEPKSSDPETWVQARKVILERARAWLAQGR